MFLAPSLAVVVSRQAQSFSILVCIQLFFLYVKMDRSTCKEPNDCKAMDTVALLTSTISSLDITLLTGQFFFEKIVVRVLFTSK